MVTNDTAVARIWHGITAADQADEYFEFLQKTGIPDYQKTPGNRGVYVLRRIEGDQAHFVLISLWDSLESVRGFSGPDVDKAFYYPEDDEFLLEKEPKVLHYDILAKP